MALTLVLIMLGGALLPLASADHWDRGRSRDGNFYFWGQVTDDDSGQGVPNATLRLLDPWDHLEALLNASPRGHFGQSIALGDYQVTIQAPGYYSLETWMGERWSSERYEQYRLYPLPAPNATVTGQVTDVNGTPLAGVRLALERNNVYHEQGRTFYGSFTTNATGNYSFDMQAGDYNLAVELDSHFPQGQGFHINNGSLLVTNFTLAAYTETALVRGYLREPDLSPAVPAQLEMHHEQGYRNQTHADPGGYYEMLVAPGNYSGYNTWGEGYSWYDNWSIWKYLGPHTTTWFNLTLERAPDRIFVSGTVYDEQKQPLANATVKLRKSQTFYGPNPGEFRELSAIHNTTVTGTNGNFLLETYQWGNQQLTVSAPGYYSDQLWWFDTGRNTTLLELYMGPAHNATVSGYVKYPNGTPAADQFVEFHEVQQGGHSEWVSLNNQTYTDATGYYEMDYWGARSEIWVHANQSHEFSRYEYYEHPHWFSSGASSFNITLTHSTENNLVRGYVTGLNATALANLTVYGSNWWGYTETTTNASGYYELNMVSNRENWLDVYYTPHQWDHPGYEEGYNQFYFAEQGETLWYNLTLVRRLQVMEDSTVFGHVYALNGTPLADAEVRLNSQNEDSPWWSNWTRTDASGSYSMGLPGGDFELWADYPGYFPNRTRSYVASGSSVMESLRLTPYPPFDATLKGYVNNTHGDALRGLIFWGLMTDQRLTHMRDHGGSLAPMFENFENYAFESTFTSNSTGYYELSVPAGRLYTGFFDLSGGAEGSRTRFIDVTAGSDHWLNYTLADYTPPAYTISGQVLDDQGWPMDWDTEVLLLKEGDFRGDTGLHLGENGSFSFPVTPGDYVLLVDRFDRDAQLKRVTITTNNYTTTFTLEYPSPTLVDRSVDFPNPDDWDHGRLTVNVSVTEDVKLARFMVDYYLGNNDGNISLAEAQDIQADLYWDLYGSQPTLLPGGTSFQAFSVDHRHYRTDGATFVLSVSGALGPVASTATLLVTGGQNITSTALIGSDDPHTFRAYTPYDEKIMELTYHVSPPSGWRYLEDNQAENVAVTGSDPVRIDPQGDPKPWDEIWEVVVEVEFETDQPGLSISYTPTYPDNASRTRATVSSQGTPTANAFFNVTGMYNSTRVLSLMTNASGGVDLGYLPAGQYHLEAEKTNHKAARKLLTVYAVGALAKMALSFSPEHPDDRSGVTFTLVNESLVPVAGALLEARHLDNFSLRWTGLTNGTGQATAMLPSGLYLVNASALNHTNTSAYVRVDEADKRLVLSIDPLYPTIGMDIWVTLTDDLGNPVSGAVLTLTRVNDGSVNWTGISATNGSALIPGHLQLEGQFKLTATYPDHENGSYSIAIHPLDEHNPEREGDSFLPGPGLGVLMLVLASLARRRKKEVR